MTQEHNDAISKANTGCKLSKKQKEKGTAGVKAFYKRRERRSQAHKKYYETHDAPNKGILHSEETKRKISERCKKSGVGKRNKGYAKTKEQRKHMSKGQLKFHERRNVRMGF